MGTRDKPMILAVDDGVTNLKILDELLSPHYRVRVATDGESALKAVERAFPDIILLDVMMPGMDGFEVCRRLKADPRTAPIPVVFLTALAETENEEKGLSLGAVDYIMKPFHGEVVRSRVRNHLELKLQRDDLESQVAARTAEIELVKEATITGMGLLAEYRDKETGSHLMRTKAYIRSLATRMEAMRPGNFTRRQIEFLTSSSVLHDIGKVATPDAILRKPGPLTAEEYAIMKGHTLVGAEMISRTRSLMGDLTFLDYAREIAESHHERYDGTGYPHGLKGDAIPLSGAIMAVADVYDALLSKRAYKAPMPHEEVCRIILEGDGRTMPSHFNPIVLEAFRACGDEFRKIGESIPD